MDGASPHLDEHTHLICGCMQRHRQLNFAATAEAVNLGDEAHSGHRYLRNGDETKTMEKNGRRSTEEGVSGAPLATWGNIGSPGGRQYLIMRHVEAHRVRHDFGGCEHGIQVVKWLPHTLCTSGNGIMCDNLRSCVYVCVCVCVCERERERVFESECVIYQSLIEMYCYRNQRGKVDA
jgi:hypothetical protein